MFYLVMDDLCHRLATDLDSAFPDFVEAMSRDIYSGLRRLAGPDEAEDLTQEAFIRAYQALNAYDRRRIENLRLRGWFWTIALNLGRNHARARARRPILVELETVTSHDPEPPDSEAWDRRLAALPSVQRRAVVLRHVVGLSYDEIGQATGRPETTVRSDVHRGLEKLRNIMEAEK
ncbi:MAG TPA: RNA polymerase sigma factor [Acidimicrobiia bacterium]|nr:RNA polymerase sigma factor [Acidimicrobiia bacterium]